MTIQQQQEFLASLNFQLPPDYAAFLFSQDAATEYDIHLLESGSHLWSAAELAEANADYRAEEFYPGYFLIGSNGGIEAFAIEKTTGYFVMIPFIGYDAESIIIISQTWSGFLERLPRDNIYD